jgi:hypothetical protein
MRIVAGVLCILLIAAGCSEKDKIPSGVIGKDEMEKIIWDMMLADQYSANYLIKDSARVNVKMETLKLYETVFRLHKVTRDEFRKSFEFYQGRPDITRTMFDSLLAKGNRARMENYSRPPSIPPVIPAVKPADSAVRARTVVTPASRQPGKPGVTTPITRPPVTFPNRPSVNPSGRPGFFPNRSPALSPGAHPFLDRGAGRPLKAGEAPFRPVGKDSVMKGRQ